MNGQWTVDAQDGNLDFLARLCVAREYDAVGCVPARDDRTALLAENIAELAVDPDLGVIIQNDLENDGRALNFKIGDPLGDGHVQAIPI